ncbi:hypothetical protein C0991_006587, partial [Blastosporella zonata]
MREVHITILVRVNDQTPEDLTPVHPVIISNPLACLAYAGQKSHWLSTPVPHQVARQTQCQRRTEVKMAVTEVHHQHVLNENTMLSLNLLKKLRG